MTQRLNSPQNFSGFRMIAPDRFEKTARSPHVIVRVPEIRTVFQKFFGRFIRRLLTVAGKRKYLNPPLGPYTLRNLCIPKHRGRKGRFDPDVDELPRLAYQLFSHRKTPEKKFLVTDVMIRRNEH